MAVFPRRPSVLVVGGDRDGTWLPLGHFETPPDDYRRLRMPGDTVVLAHATLSDQGAVFQLLVRYRPDNHAYPVSTHTGARY
jgi:hypothetical protein